MNGRRIVFADWLRITACFLVMLVHAAENFYGADSSGLAGNVSMLANESNRFWVAFYDGFCARSCVPLFIVLSSFLLVPMKPGQTMTGFYRKRFGHVLPPMILFMFLYCILPLAWGGMTWEQSLADLKMIPWNFPSMAGHLWFMYPLLSLYLIIPVVSPWLEKSTAKEELIFIGLFVVSTFIPFIHRFIAEEIWGECFWNGFSLLWYCSGFLGYLVLSHFIRFHLKWNKSRRMIIGAISFLAGAAFTGWSFWLKGEPGVILPTPDLEWAWHFCSPNVLAATFGLFLMFSCIKGDRTPEFVTSLSKLSFGMYLMHLFYLAPIAKAVIGGDTSDPAVPVWAAIPLIACATFICCAITSWLISKIPGSKWIIGT